mgnify:CR=1 FL=1
MSDDSVVVARVDGLSVHLSDLARSPEHVAALRHVFHAAAVRRIIVEAAEAAHIEVCRSELQQAANDYRLRHGLRRADETLRWLAERGLEPSDLQTEIHYLLLRKKLEEHLVGAQVERWFHEHKSTFDLALLAHVVVADEGVAHELMAELSEGEVAFDVLARRHSLDAETAASGGLLPPLRRKAMRAQLQSQVFGASSGDVVGPFEISGGWEIVRVYEVRRAVLTEALEAEICEHLFTEWLEQAMAAHVVMLWPFTDSATGADPSSATGMHP